MKKVIFMLFVVLSFIACSQNDNDPIAMSSSQSSELT